MLPLNALISYRFSEPLCDKERTNAFLIAFVNHVTVENRKWDMSTYLQKSKKTLQAENIKDLLTFL